MAPTTSPVPSGTGSTLTRTLAGRVESGALRLAVAADTAALAEPVGRFNHMLLIALGALAAA